VEQEQGSTGQAGKPEDVTNEENIPEEPITEEIPAESFENNTDSILNDGETTETEIIQNESEIIESNPQAEEENI
jgi:hypothetical protein